MRYAITLPTGFAMMMLIFVGLAMIIGLALPQDIDLAIFFATMFGGIFLILGGAYWVAERFSRRIEREKATSVCAAHPDRIWWGGKESTAISAMRRHAEPKSAPPIWGYSRS